MPNGKIRLGVDLSSIEECAEVNLLPREDFQDLPTVPEDDLRSSQVLLPPLGRNDKAASFVDFFNDGPHRDIVNIWSRYLKIWDRVTSVGIDFGFLWEG